MQKAQSLPGGSVPSTPGFLAGWDHSTLCVGKDRLCTHGQPIALPTPPPTPSYDKQRRQHTLLNVRGRAGLSLVRNR